MAKNLEEVLKAAKEEKVTVFCAEKVGSIRISPKSFPLN